MDFDKLILGIRRQLAQRAAAYVDKNSVTFKRDPSKTEKEAEWQPLHVTRSCTFCVHGKSYFTRCTACRRDQREAQFRFEEYCRKNNIRV